MPKIPIFVVILTENTCFCFTFQKSQNLLLQYGTKIGRRETPSRRVKQETFQKSSTYFCVISTLQKCQKYLFLHHTRECSHLFLLYFVKYRLLSFLTKIGAKIGVK